MNLDKYKNQFENFKDKELFPSQQQGVEWFAQQNRKVNLLCAPTGSGKSLLAAVTAAMQPVKPVAYLCSSIMLQQQIEKEFPEFKVMYGRRNFRCNYLPNRQCDECSFEGDKNAKRECIENNGCLYEERKQAVLESDFQCLNYTYFMFEANYVGRFSDYSLIICDEADALEKIVTSFIRLEISNKRLKNLGLTRPRYKTAGKKGLPEWKSWARNCMNKIAVRLPDEGENPADFSESDRKYFKRLSALHSQLSLFLNCVDATWLYQERKGMFATHVFYPQWLTEDLVKAYFWKHSEKFMLMSATFPPRTVFSKQMGIAMDQLEYIELPSTFPIENRKVWLDPTAKMTYKTMQKSFTIDKILNKVRSIANDHPNEKGLIHCVNYRLVEAIGSIDPGRMITHNGQNKLEKLQRFMDSRQPKIFLSPSSTRGLDLKGNLCRWIIFVKAPFQSLADKLVSSRLFGSGPVGEQWYISDMLLEIVQGTGRACRTKDDYCVTYLLDTKAIDAITSNKEFLPQWWLESVDLKW